MSLGSWRTFGFFELTPIRDPSPPGTGDVLYSDPGITAICAGRDSAFLANSQGIIKEFSKDMQIKSKFRAVEENDTATITRLRFLTGTGLLLTIAEKQGHPVTVSLWDLNKIDTASGNPHLHSSEHVVNGSNTYPLSAFDINKDYNILGFGFADGSVILLRGDIIHDRGARQRVVYNSNSPITGLAFNYSANVTATMYVVSVTQVLTVPTTGKNPGKAETMLERSKGAALDCVAKVDDLNEQYDLIVARDDEVTYYSPKLRGASFVFDVPKKMIFPYKHYLVIVSVAQPSPTSSTVLSSLIDSTTSRVLVLDTVNKCIAFNGQISNGVRDIFVQWDNGRLNILSTDGVLYALKERSLDTRLDIVKQRHLFDFALQLATYFRAPDSVTTQIHREFGDYLYGEGEFDAALTHYVEAIDPAKTSEVILKYRDAQYIDSLITFLEALHEKDLATKEHTSLLLNSYAKQKQVDKLNAFIEAGSGQASFDYETAIRICRQAGYYSLAMFLASKTGDADLAFEIRLRDVKDYKGCLQYAQSLQVADTLRILIEYSRTLLDIYPMETTALLISLFTGKYVSIPMEIALGDDKSIDAASTAESQSNYAAPVLQSYRAFVGYMSDGMHGALNSINFRVGSNGRTAAANGSADDQNDGPTYQPPRPRLIFSSFLDHTNEFVIFLEACLESYRSHADDIVNPKDEVDILTTLFEMYLALGNKAGTSEQQTQWFDKARALAISNSKVLDQNSILLLSHMASFHDEQVQSLNEDEGFQTDLFRSCMATRDVKGAISLLHKYGHQDKELYLLALQFFSSSADIVEEAGDEFRNVLDVIKRDRIMSPLEVVKVLSTNPVITVGHVREYLLEVISAEQKDIDTNHKLSDSYRNETTTKRTEIDHLLHEPQVVQYGACASCTLPLDLPAVHFGCGHSFHQRCLNASDVEEPVCPICQHDVESLRVVRKAQDELGERNDLFVATLAEADNKFKVITEFIGRGALTSTF